MKFSSTLVLLSSVLSLAYAAPAPEPEPAAEVPPTMYRFKTQVIGTKNRQYGGLFLSTYHTGAGENTVVVDSEGVPAFFNGSRLVFRTTGGDDNNYGVKFQYASLQDLWAGATANIFDSGDQGFAIKRNGQLTYSSSDFEFTGWRVCAWSLSGSPQLFHDYFEAQGVVPANCARVNLMAIPQ